MAIIKDVTVKITNNNATLDMPLQIYELDHGIELRFKLMDYKYKYTKDPQNILNSSDEDILEAYTTIINPRGYELQQINGEVKDDIVIFMIDSSYTDEIDEIGTYSLQIHIKCACSEFSIPPIQFEVLQRLKGIKVVTDGEDSIDDSALIDNYSNFISDETGKLLIEWKKGDIISSVKLNAMVEVINNAVDEEVQRQANEVKREQQELERQNKVREALNSVDNRVDEAMNEYETRFNALTASQQQDMEVIDARDGEVSLKARLDRDLRNPLQVYENVEGSYISCDSVEGYAQNVEILGNTIQNQNDLADIRSVGDKLENQELYEIPVLSTGKNLFHPDKLNIDSENIYGYFYIGNASNYTVSIKDRDTSVDIQGLYFGLSMSGTSSTGGVSWNVGNGNIMATKVTHPVYKYFSIHPNTKEALEKLSQRFYIQLEEGTAATPYEPYQGHKLTILSPIQLEKVGDVADRLICKDGVWGVEKNIKTIYTKDFANYIDAFEDKEATFKWGKSVDTKKLNVMSNFIPKGSLSTEQSQSQIMIYNHTSYREFRIAFKKADFPNFDVKANVVKYLSDENKYIKVVQDSQFIPLPHDQQIKLRTFANKTNIHFLTEIEPTLKASVPKSIGATVNSHTEQIDNLSKELDKVKKLEESTVSTVTTESSFTTVDATSNGYFEDVKLEGKTLVNKAISRLYTFNQFGVARVNLGDIKGDITIIPYMSSNIMLWGAYDKVKNVIPYSANTSPLFLNTQEEYKQLDICIKPNEDVENITYPLVVDLKFLVLEGDHTQNPPEFFEGLKSVGDGVDEISVLSCNENLFDKEYCYKKSLENDKSGEITRFYENGKDIIRFNQDGTRMILHDNFKENTQYTIKLKMRKCIDNVSEARLRLIYSDSTTKENAFETTSTEFVEVNYTTDKNKTVLRIENFFGNGQNFSEIDLDSVVIVEGTEIKDIQRKQDKKPLLYYNPTTDTWGKPILRQWDSIEKHSDGKYYYHKRSGEVVFNGSENWGDYGPSASNESSKCFYVVTSISRPRTGDYMCDRLSTGVYNADLNAINDITKVTNSLYFNTNSKYSNYAYIRVELSKMSSQDVAGFKAWLQSKPITVVYQLEKEEVYECTSIDLMSYENETNYMVTAGAIAPVSTLKVMCNINNVVRELQQKVSNLENYIQHVMIDALNNALNE